MVRFLGHRNEVLVHLLGAVLVPGGLLHGGPAAEIEVPAGHRRRAARGSGAFEDQDPRTRGGGADRGATTGNAESDHHDVHVVGPVRHARGVEGLRQLGRHCCSCFT